MLVQQMWNNCFALEWGVTTESLLQVARIILGLQDAKGNAKPVVAAGARSTDSKQKDTSTVQAKNNATKKTDGSVLRENQATNSTKPKVSAAQSKQADQSQQKATVVKPKSNAVNDAKTNQSSANESILDSSNEDLDHLSLASLLSLKASNVKSNTNNTMTMKQTAPQTASTSKPILANPLNSQNSTTTTNFIVTSNAKPVQNKKKTVHRNSQPSQYPNLGPVSETEEELGNYERIAKHVSQSPPRSVPHTVDLDSHERQVTRVIVENCHQKVNGNVDVNVSGKHELQLNRNTKDISTPQSSNRAQKRKSSVKNSPQLETAAASPRNCSPVARGSVRSPPMMAGSDVAGVNRTDKIEATPPSKHHFVVSSPPAKNPCIENMNNAPANVLPSPTMDIQQILNQIKMMQNSSRDVIQTEQTTAARPAAQISVNHQTNGVNQNVGNNLRAPTSPVHVDVNSRHHYRNPHVHAQQQNANQCNPRHPRIKAEVQQHQSVVSGSGVSLPTFEQLVSPQQYHSPPFVNNNNPQMFHHTNGSHHISPKRTLPVQEASPSNEQNQIHNRVAINTVSSNFASPESQKKFSLAHYLPRKTSPALVSPVNSQVPSLVNQNNGPQFQNQQRQQMETGFNLNNTSPVLNGTYLNQMLDGTNLTPLQYPATIMGTNSLLQMGSAISPVLPHISHQQVQNHVQFRPNFSFGSPEKQ